MTRTAVLFATALVLAGVSWTSESEVRAQAPSSGDIRVLPLRGNVYVLTGAGANIVASVGKDGVLLVDSGPAQMTDKILATVRDLSRRVTASPMPQRSCVGMPQGCQWWGSSELLPTTAAMAVATTMPNV